MVYCDLDHVGAFLWLLVTSITVEPACFLFSASRTMFLQISGTAIYQRVCHDIYPMADCGNSSSVLSKAQQDVVQAEVANRNMYNGIAGIILTCPALLLWSAWADMNGRKAIMMISLTGFALTCLIYTAVSVNDNVPMWLLPTAILLLGITGSTVLFFNAAIQYISDIVSDKKMLTLRVMIILSCNTAGGVIGGMITPVLLTQGIGFGPLLLIAQSLLIPTELFVLWLVKQVLPCEGAGRRDHKVSESTTGPSAPGSHNNDPRGTKDGHAVTACSAALNLPKDVWHVFSRKRDGRKRLYCLLSLAGFFLYGTDFAGTPSSLLNTYVFKSPLSFSAADYSTFTLINTFTSFVCNILAAGIVTKVLYWPDTFLILLSLCGAVLQMIIYALSRQNWMIWVGGCVGAFGFVGISALQTLFSWLVSPREMGTVIAGFGVAQQLSALLSDVLYPQVYRATLTWYAGFVYFLTAAIVSIALGLFLFIHLDLWKQSFYREERAPKATSAPADPEKQHLLQKSLSESYKTFGEPSDSSTEKPLV